MNKQQQQQTNKYKINNINRQKQITSKTLNLGFS